MALPKPWTVVLWELNTATKLSSQRLCRCALCSSPQWEGSSFTCGGSAGFWRKSKVTLQDQTSCMIFLCFLSVSIISSSTRGEKKAKKYHEGRCIPSQLQHFFSMWLNIPIKSMIKSLDPLGYEPGQTSSSAELHVPFWNSWTKDKIPPVQESFLKFIFLYVTWASMGQAMGDLSTNR